MTTIECIIQNYQNKFWINLLYLHLKNKLHQQSKNLRLKFIFSELLELLINLSFNYEY